jgi:hypothetical protein
VVFYRLKIRTIRDDILQFSVEEYSIVDDGVFVEFTDRYTSRTYRFPIANVNIEKIEGEL